MLPDGCCARNAQTSLAYAHVRPMLWLRCPAAHNLRLTPTRHAGQHFSCTGPRRSSISQILRRPPAAAAQTSSRPAASAASRLSGMRRMQSRRLLPLRQAVHLLPRSNFLQRERCWLPGWLPLQHQPPRSRSSGHRLPSRTVRRALPHHRRRCSSLSSSSTRSRNRSSRSRSSSSSSSSRSTSLTRSHSRRSSSSSMDRRLILLQHLTSLARRRGASGGTSSSIARQRSRLPSSSNWRQHHMRSR